MGDAARKAELFEQLARVGKAMGSGKRLELLDLLVQKPRAVLPTSPPPPGWA